MRHARVRTVFRLSLALVLLLSLIPIESCIGAEHHWVRDADQNGIDDVLEREMQNTSWLSYCIDYASTSDVNLEHLAFLKIRFVSRYLPVVCVEGPSRSVKRVSSLPGVLMVEADPEIVPYLDTSVRTMKIDRVRAKYQYDGSGVTIAVIDTGIDAEHVGLDDLDDNNATDDRKVVAFYDAKDMPYNTDGGTQPYDNDGHGSHVAGIAAGSGAPGYNYTGIAPGARLVGVRVIGEADNKMDDAMRGIEWAMENKDKYGIRVLSMSFGAAFSMPVSNDGTSAISRLCNQAVDMGLVVVVAAGNDGPRRKTIAPPADAEKVITVGNVEDSGSLNPTSSRGPVGTWPNSYIKPDICAPGTDVHSVKANSHDGYVSMSGTSMSAPHVSGLVALMLQAKPELTPDEVKSILERTADPGRMYPMQPVPNNDYGYGVVNAMKAIREVTGGRVPPEVEVHPLPDIVIENVTVEGTSAGQNASVERVELRIDHEAWQVVDGTTSWRYVWDTTVYENGYHTVCARAWDGEMYSASACTSTAVNNVHITSSVENGSVVSGNVTFRGRVDAFIVTTVKAGVDGNLEEITLENMNNLTLWKYSFDSTRLSDGRHIFVINVYDGAYTHTLRITFTVRNQYHSYTAPVDWPSMVMLAFVLITFSARRTCRSWDR